MKLQFIPVPVPVPVWSPPHEGPWRIRQTSPSGEIYVWMGWTNLYHDRAEADERLGLTPPWVAAERHGVRP